MATAETTIKQPHTSLQILLSIGEEEEEGEEGEEGEGEEGEGEGEEEGEECWDLLARLNGRQHKHQHYEIQ